MVTAIAIGVGITIAIPVVVYLASVLFMVAIMRQIF